MPVFSSKLFLILAAVTLLLIGATLTFQVMEGQTYNLFNTLQERFLGGNQTTATSSEAAK
jgi:hypothetical protein